MATPSLATENFSLLHVEKALVKLTGLYQYCWLGTYTRSIDPHNNNSCTPPAMLVCSARAHATLPTDDITT